MWGAGWPGESVRTQQKDLHRKQMDVREPHLGFVAIPYPYGRYL